MNTESIAGGSRIVTLVAAIVLAAALATMGLVMQPEQAQAAPAHSTASALALQKTSAAKTTATKAAKAKKAKKAKMVKKAKKAYKSFLAKNRSIKRFKVVKMGNGGIPVLLYTKQKPFTGLGANYIITANVVIYDKSQKSKVRDLGAIGTGGTAFQLQYAKGAVYGFRIAGMHTFTVVKVKSGHLSMSGIYDNQYGSNVRWRHFSNYDPATMGSLASSKALGKFGNSSDYSKLVKKYGSHPLSMYKNTKKNRAKRI